MSVKQLVSQIVFVVLMTRNEKQRLRVYRRYCIDTSTLGYSTYNKTFVTSARSYVTGYDNTLHMGGYQLGHRFDGGAGRNNGEH